MRDQIDDSAATILQMRMAELKEKFIDTLDSKIADLDRLMQYLENPELAERACREIRTRVHKIHGTAGTMGFPRMGALASQLENFIDKLFNAGPVTDTKFVGELLDSLLDEMESAVEDG